MIEINETQLKILHLLDLVPFAKHTTNFLSSKLGLHQNTVRNHLGTLKEKGLIKACKSDHQSIVYYDLNKSLSGKINDVCVVVGG